MRFQKAVTAAVLLLALTGHGAQCQGKTPFKGLTGTLASLLSSKPGTSISIGSRKYVLEALVDDDIAGNFDCDAEISEYIDRDGVLYYETLADIIETKIRRGFDGEDGSLFVVVDGSEEGSLMRFSFYVHRERPVTLSIVLATKDADFLASCRAQSVAAFEFSAELQVDSDLVMKDEMTKGIRLDVAKYSLRLKSGIDDADLALVEGDSPGPSPIALKADFEYRGTSAEAEAASFDIDYRAEWYLLGPGQGSADTDDDSNLVSYDAIREGDFSWESWVNGRVGLWSSTRAESDEAPPVGNALAFDFSAEEESGAARQELLYVYDGEWLLLESPTTSAK